jgi:hypothetical protein
MFLKDKKILFQEKYFKMQQNQCVQNVKSFLTEHCQKLQMRRNFTKNFQNSILGKIYCTPKIKNIIKILKIIKLNYVFRSAAPRDLDPS